MYSRTWGRQNHRYSFSRLRARGAVYECACSRRELEAAPTGAVGERVYPGTCRDGIPAERAGRTQRAWRVRVDAAGIAFRDRLQGPSKQLGVGKKRFRNLGMECPGSWE